MEGKWVPKFKTVGNCAICRKIIVIRILELVYKQDKSDNSIDGSITTTSFYTVLMLGFQKYYYCAAHSLTNNPNYNIIEHVSLRV